MAGNNVIPTEADIVIGPRPSSEVLAQAIRTGSKLTVEGDSTDGSEMLLSVLSAANIDDVFGSEMTPAKTILGTPLVLHSFEGLRSSDFDDSTLGVWAIFRATNPDGELLTVGTGAADAVVKLVKLDELGAFDNKTTVAFEESKKATANGWHPVNLVLLSKEGF